MQLFFLREGDGMLFIVFPCEGKGRSSFTLGNEQVACGDDVHTNEHVGFVVDDTGFHSPDCEWRYCGFYDNHKFINRAFSHGAYAPEGGLAARAQVKPPGEAGGDDCCRASCIPNSNNTLGGVFFWVLGRYIREYAVGFFFKSDTKQAL